MPAPLLLIASAGRRSALGPVLRAAGLSFAESDPSDHPKNLSGAPAALLDLELPEAAVILAHAKGAGVCVVGLVPRGGDASLAQGLWGLGLDDLVREEALAAELAPRLQARMRERNLLQEASQRESEMAALVDLTRALASSLDLGSLLHELVRRVGAIVEVERCSLALVDEPRGLGYIVAASDREQAKNLRIDLSLYPEIKEALRTQDVVVVADAPHHPLLDPVRELIVEEGISALAVFPLVSEGTVSGILMLRAKGRAVFGAREIAFVKVVAEATAQALKNAAIFEGMRSAAAVELSARQKAEQRTEALRRYEDFFAHLAEGVAIISHDLKVLALNPAGQAILGGAHGGQAGLLLATARDASGRRFLSRVLRGREGAVIEDLELVLPSGEKRILAVQGALLHGQSGAAILSFRDETGRRALEAELEKTKDFLERLIDASPDGIIASDRQGQVLLFSKSAERLSGWKREEVIGKMNVTKLYPDGMAHEIMARMRAGQGKVEILRTEILSKSGEHVPVNLSAAIVYEHGDEAASVGIFRDLRERLEIEERLSRTERALADREREALVTELSGAAAHELNQPLTSILGYLELLQRKVTGDDPLARTLEILYKESERIAEIVRRIGQVSRYQTKPYVGESRILDLEASAPLKKP